MSVGSVSFISRGAKVFVLREGKTDFDEIGVNASVKLGEKLVVTGGEIYLKRGASSLVLKAGTDWQVTEAVVPNREANQLNVRIESDVDDDGFVGNISSKTFVLAIALPPANSAAFNGASKLVVELGGNTQTLEITDQMRAEGVVYMPYTLSAVPSSGQQLQFSVELQKANGAKLLTGEANMTVFEGAEPEAPTLSVAIREDANNDGSLSESEVAGKSRLSVDIKLDNKAQVGDVLLLSTNGGQAQEIVLTRQHINRKSVTVKRNIPVEGESLTVEARLETQNGGRSPKVSDSATVEAGIADAPTIRISEDVNNNRVLNADELGNQRTVSTEITLGDGSKVGDRLIVWQNGPRGIRGWKTAKILTQQDIDEGKVAFEVKRPPEGWTLKVKSQLVTSSGEKTEVSPVDRAKIDTQGPKVTISSVDTLEKGESVKVKFTFNEAPRGFTQSDISVSGGSLSQFKKVNGKYWTATFKADGSDTTPDIRIANGKFTDVHGNAGKGDSKSLRLEADRTPEKPQVEIVRDLNNDGVLNRAELEGFRRIEVKVAIGDNTVAGDRAHVTVNGQLAHVRTLSQEDINKGYFTRSFDNPGEGNTFKVQAVVKTPDGVFSANSDLDSALIDTTGPKLTISGAPDYVKPGEAFSLTFDFDEAPVGFSAADIQLQQGNLSNFTQVSDKQWTADFTSTASSISNSGHQIKVANGSFTDQYANAGTGDMAQTQLNQLGVDFTAPGAQSLHWERVYVTCHKTYYVNLRVHPVLLPNFTLRDSADEIIGVDIVHTSGFGGYRVYVGTGPDSYKNWEAYSAEDITSQYSNKGELKDGVWIQYHNSQQFNALINGPSTTGVKMRVTSKDAQTGEVITQDHDFQIGHNMKYSSVSPLILDLDGDGVETLAVEQGVNFDINADGRVDNTGWVGVDDGLLVRDINGDGLINDARELFGEHTLTADGSEAAEGFTALADLDSNGDGVFDANDDAYAEVQIWQDSNSDGVSQAHELYSLLDMGVAAIDLSAVAITENNNGNTAGLRSSWTDTEGNNHTVDDIWFKYQSGAGELSALEAGDLLTSDEAIPGLVGVADTSTASMAAEPAQAQAISCYSTSEMQAEQLLVEQPQLDH